MAASAVEVAGEQVAAGQPQADLALLEPVALAARRREGLGQRRPGAVDEPGLEEHLGLVEPGPVTRDRGIHGVGLTHQDQGPGEVPVDEGQAGEVVPGLELLVGQPVLGRGLGGPTEVGLGVDAVAQAQVCQATVDVEGAALAGVELHHVAPHPVQRRQGCRPVPPAPVDDALLHVAEGQQQPVVDRRCLLPGVVQHGRAGRRPLTSSSVQARVMSTRTRSRSGLWPAMPSRTPRAWSSFAAASSK